MIPFTTLSYARKGEVSLKFYVKSKVIRRVSSQRSCVVASRMLVPLPNICGDVSRGLPNDLLSFPLNPNVYMACIPYKGGSLTEGGVSALYYPHGKHPAAEAETLMTWDDPVDKEHLWGVL